MRLLERTQDPDKREKYCRIVRQKLEDLETLLEELFLYTRLTGNEFPIEMKKIQLFPVLCDALAGFYPPFSGRTELLLFPLSRKMQRYKPVHTA